MSEVMLQQTQVDRAIDRFEAFITRWPTAADLAVATNDEVLSEWSGLGYNSRALRLRDAARMVTDNGWPTDSEGLMELPGVGAYTAAAVASIAFGEQVPAVDTNLKRVLSRWYGEPLRGSLLNSVAVDEVGEPSGDWNQALMDLGSTLCTTQSPNCDQCPVTRWCADPTVYEPPRRQPAFSGSRRELRGSLVRAHLSGDDLHEVGSSLGRSPEEVNAVIDDLMNEGLVS